MKWFAILIIMDLRTQLHSDDFNIIKEIIVSSVQNASILQIMLQNSQEKHHALFPKTNLKEEYCSVSIMELGRTCP